MCRRGEFKTGSAVDENLYDSTELPGFFIGEKEVSFGEYREFYDSLDSAEARKLCAPMFLFSPVERNYEPIFCPNGAIRAPFTASMPVVGINAAAAKRYCQWYGRKHNLKCRLPTVLEWEKAARGVDGRSYVWGSDYNPNFPPCAPTTLPSPSIPTGRHPEPSPKTVPCTELWIWPAMSANTAFRRPGSNSAQGQVKGGGFNSGRYLLMCHSMPGNCFGNEPDAGFRILIEP